MPSWVAEHSVIGWAVAAVAVGAIVLLVVFGD